MQACQSAFLLFLFFGNFFDEKKKKTEFEVSIVMGPTLMMQLHKIMPIFCVPQVSFFTIDVISSMKGLSLELVKYFL